MVTVAKRVALPVMKGGRQAHAELSKGRACPTPQQEEETSF